MPKVYVSRSSFSRNRYHTDEDCSMLRNEPREMSKELFDARFDIPICSYCSGDYELPSQGHGLAKKLESMSPDEI